MLWIGRPAVVIDHDVEAARLDLLLARVMAAGAKALQRAEAEQIPVAAMRRFMIDVRGRRDDAVRSAEIAERMLQQLQPAAALPEPHSVEVLPKRQHGRLRS